MGSMLDLPGALRAAGLTVWVAPDWLANGHGTKADPNAYNLIRPFGGVLHHTAGYGLRAVYGLPDARPDVPQPRCNLWTPRPGTKPYDIAVICAGRAWQAGSGRMLAYDQLRLGRFSVRVADAAVRFGPDSDDVDAGWTSAHTLGNEVEWNTGDPWTDAQLDVVAAAMNVCVDVLDWPGLGCWAHHRQLTYRKPDMAYRGDIWTRAAELTHPPEDNMPFSDEDKAFLRALTGAGGGTTVTGVTQQAYNLLHADLATMQADVDAARADLDAVKAELDEVKKLVTPTEPPPPPPPST